MVIIYKIADYAFLSLIISLFIQSCIASGQARKLGVYSFFGFISIGNIILIFILTYAIHIRDWFLNEIVYNILTISIETQFFNWFFANSYYIAMVWYVILLFLNIVDFKSAIGNRNFVGGSDKRFEE